MSQINSKTHGSILEVVNSIIASHPGTQAVLGENFNDVEETAIALHNVSFSPEEGLKIEISTTTEASKAAFEWLAEITLDRGGQDYKHYLVKPDSELVEAYGRNIVEVDDAGAEILLKELNLASASLSK